MTVETLDHEVSDCSGRHALTNVLIIGSYLEFLARRRTDLARAWLDVSVSLESGTMALRTHGPYSKTPRPVLKMVLQPMSEGSRVALTNDIDLVRDVVATFSSEPGGVLELTSVVWVEIDATVRPTAEDRFRDIVDALTACGEGGAAVAAELEDVRPEMLIGWSSYASQRVQHVALADGDEQSVARVTEILKAVGDFLWSHGHRQLVTGELNNISYASVAPGPQLLRAAADATPVPGAARKWRVGVIVPGGPAAHSDIEDVERHPDVECDLRRVYRGEKNFAAEMSSALSAFKADHDAILIAYGGGSKEDLAKIHAALAPHLDVLGYRAGRLSVTPVTTCP